MEKVRSVLFKGMQVDVGIVKARGGFRVCIQAKNPGRPRTWTMPRVYPSREEAVKWARAYAVIIALEGVHPEQAN